MDMASMARKDWLPKTAFADGTPYLLISEESLNGLNKHFPDDKKMTMRRFRPNIVIKGCKPYEEDTWKFIRIGDAEFRCLYRCPRCTLPTVDPETGVKDGKEPLNTLKSYRLVPKEEDARYGGDPTFGRNLTTEKSGVIRVGDTVYASM